MAYSVAAPHARGKEAKDTIFAANGRANQLAAEIGKENVINATIGSILDEDGNLVVLPVVQEELKTLTPQEICAYSPIPGLPKFREACIDQCFGKSRPDAYLCAIATPGGTGALHHAIHNYSEIGDEVLITDWHWGAYDSMIKDNNRRVHSFSFLTEDGHFNTASFEKEVTAILAKQDNIVIILNGIANNPTGYNMPPAEWQACIDVLKKACQDPSKHAILVPDVAYLDYSGPKDQAREFFKVFGNLPKNILVAVAYTLSKGFTLYGQRIGALIGISSDKDVIHEFENINEYSNRATWSNCSSAAENTMIKICSDPKLLKEIEDERHQYFQLIQKRAAIFMKEAPEVGLKVLPYISGFFITIPVSDAAHVCEIAEKNEHTFMVPLAKGIRLAVCSVSLAKMKGLAAKVKRSIDAAGVKQ